VGDNPPPARYRKFSEKHRELSIGISANSPSLVAFQKCYSKRRAGLRAGFLLCFFQTADGFMLDGQRNIKKPYKKIKNMIQYT